jgi:hypothetical protein
MRGNGEVNRACRAGQTHSPCHEREAIQKFKDACVIKQLGDIAVFDSAMPSDLLTGHRFVTIELFGKKVTTF